MKRRRALKNIGAAVRYMGMARARLKRRRDMVF